MKMEIRYANHPEDSKFYTTEDLRDHYLVENMFEKDDISLVYSHQDRIIAGGVMPVTKKLALETSKELAADYFLQRREMGFINIGGEGKVTLDGKKYTVLPKDGMYIGKGTKEIVFESVDSKNPAKFYVNSCPAHKTYPTVQIEFAKANQRPLGNNESMNKRTIFQYVHPAVCESCQLAMGLTILDKNNSWNTMPPHTHERRMEVYFYFDMDEETSVFHLMGTMEETRHIVMKNEQAVISPSWSIHSGVGTKNYSFIWGMCGENQEFDDMDHIASKNMK